VLLAAALLKAYDAAAGPAQVRPLFSRLLELGLIESELIVGGMLLLNVLPLAARYLALAMFTFFAVVSLRKLIQGSSTCGCFGPIDVNPKLTAAVDLLLVLLLALVTPPRRTMASASVRRRVGLVTLVILMVLSAGAVGFAAMPKRGLVVDGSAVHDFGVIAPQRAVCQHAFVIRNTAERSIRITGFGSSCGCTVAELPESPIEPGGSAQVLVRADWSGVVGKPYARVTLLTDSFWTRRLLLTVDAEIPPAPQDQPASAPH
jgi:hypothetical protein